ncbi:MAG: efflux RND transporter periplasmic adaptor subunit [Cytophagales bacterium]|nr:MAG: efflux RND transporter periplasmic adaptor subunit [Cytophagales bacterium]
MAKKKKRNWTRIIIISVVSLIALVVILRISGVFGRERVNEVSIEKAKKADIVETVTASGKIQPEIQVKISPDVSGEITEVNIKEGDSVIVGQKLIRIRPDNLQAVVQNSQAVVNTRQANLAQAQSEMIQRKSELSRTQIDFERSKQLYEQKVISEADFQLARMNYEVAQQRVEASVQNIEAARYNIQSAQASLSQSADNLSRTEIYAPMSGIVSKLTVEKGEKVVGTATMSGTEMLIIADLSNMEVQIDVNENDIVKVKLGQEAEIEVDSYSNRKFKGLVTEIANTANPTATADAVTEFKVKIRILSSSYKDLIDGKTKLSPFRPGMTASVNIITNRKKDALSVPLAAVTTRNPKDEKVGQKEGQQQQQQQQKTDGKQDSKTDELQEVVFVFDEKEGKVSKRIVKTGISDFENIEILSGIKEGETVVIGPFNLLSKTLKEGDKVKKAEEKREKSGS